ncbi:ribokinase [Streptomyces sp. SBT349]|uniref:ribokinase n=1 Tax=Streptomyces sp. SBT349 TaxID=1580539 RepID=UPI0007C75173|nr:ribokinase [Streptomyces sp. SBT349]
MSRAVRVVGSLNLDRRVSVRRLPGPGETVAGREPVTGLGGKGANQAVAAARAGARTALVGAVGDDPAGESAVRALTSAGVEVAGVRAVAGVATGSAWVTVDAGGENAIVVCPGANARLGTEDVRRGLAAAGPGDVVVLQLEVPGDAVRFAAALGRRRGATVVLNAAPVPEALGGLLDDVSLLVVNEHEARAIARAAGVEPGEDPTALARALGLTVVRTLGADGATAATGRRVLHAAAPRVRAVDTTGAGDAFTGYLAAALAAAPHDLAAALDGAVRAGALAVTRPGALDAIPHAKEVSAPLPTRPPDGHTTARNATARNATARNATARKRT